MKPASRASVLFALVAVAFAASWASAQSLEIIDLRFRSATEVIPLLQPLLEQDGALTGQDYKLFVRTSPENLAQLRQALAAIDREPRQLRVLVRETTQGELQREQVAVSGRVSTGDVDSAAVDVRAGSLHTHSRGSDTASVLVLEGGSAFIATGESVPLVTAVAVRGGRRPLAATGTEYRDLTRGFYVTPRVNGERVVLDVEHRSAQRSTSNAATIATGEIHTQVSGRLGDWLELGRVTESAIRSDRGIASGSRATESDARGVWIRVEIAH